MSVAEVQWHAVEVLQTDEWVPLGANEGRHSDVSGDRDHHVMPGDEQVR